MGRHGVLDVVRGARFAAAVERGVHLLCGVEACFLEGGFELLRVEGLVGGAGAAHAVRGRGARAVGGYGHGAAADAGGLAGALGVFGGVAGEADWGIVSWGARV